MIDKIYVKGFFLCVIKIFIILLLLRFLINCVVYKFMLVFLDFCGLKF